MKRLIIILYIMFLIFILNLYGSAKQASADIKTVLKKISPSIVRVIAEDGRRYIASGIVIEKGFVVSNAKIAAHPVRKIFVKTYKGKNFQAEIVGSDKRTSIILLKVDKSLARPAKTGKEPVTGDWAGLVGAFYKTFPYIKSGIVSSTDKERLILNSTVMPGTTGGAVVNSSGELVGMIRGMVGFQYYPKYVYKDSATEINIIPDRKIKGNQCLALPIKKVKKVVMDLKAHGYVRRGWLGVNISGVYGGVVRIDRVEKGSAAEKGGLRSGDIIIGMDGDKIKSASGVAEFISSKRPGDKVKMKLLRNKRKVELAVKLGDFRDRRSSVRGVFSLKNFSPVIPELMESLPVFNSYVYKIAGPVRLSINTVVLTPELAGEFGVTEKGGLLISRITTLSKRNIPGLKVGDILVRANGKLLTTPDVLKKLVVKIPAEKKLKLDIYRKGERKSVNISKAYLAGSGSAINNFRKKIAEMKYWLEMNEKMKLKLQLEKLKRLEEKKLREVLEKNRMKGEALEFEREKEILRKEYLKRIKEELKKLKQEKLKIEKELKKKKKKKSDG